MSGSWKWSIILLPLALVSCSSPKAPILHGIGSTVETDRKSAEGMPFGRTLSLAAAAPFTDVGNVWRYDQDAGYSTAMGVVKGNSYISRTVVDAPEGYDKGNLKDLQKSLLKLQSAAAERVSARFNEVLTKEANLQAFAENRGKLPTPVAPKEPAGGHEHAGGPQPPAEDTVPIEMGNRRRDGRNGSGWNGGRSVSRAQRWGRSARRGERARV